MGKQVMNAELWWETSLIIATLKTEKYMGR